MSWLNLNQSLNSLKGQITNFASEVLSEGNVRESDEDAAAKEPGDTDLKEKCKIQELEIESLKKLNEELQASLQAERLSGRNGVKEDESSWYWDPPPQKTNNEDIENKYKNQIQSLQKELSALKERQIVELRPENAEELHRLRQENINLNNNLEDLDNQHQLAMDRLLTLKQELQNNFQALKQEHEDLKSSNDEYLSEIKSLSEKIKERDKEIETLKSIKSEHETIKHKYQNLERVHMLLTENAEKFQEENQDLNEEVFKLQEQVTKLEHDIELASRNVDVTDSVPKENYEQVLKQLNDLKKRRSSDHFHLDEVNIDDNAKSVIENLKRDISDLKVELKSKEGNRDQADYETIKAEKILHLYNQYVNFELPVDYVEEIPSGDGFVVHKLERAFQTLNSFKKEIDILQQKLSEKNLNVSHLQTQIDDLTSENDFLTTDLQHLERELNEMKKNNDFLISEIAALKNTSKLEPIIESHEDNIVKLESELADCNRINKTFEERIATVEKELNDVTAEKINLEYSLNDLKQKYRTTLEEFEECKNQTKAVEELEHLAITETNEHLNKATDEIGELKKRLNTAYAKNEQQSINIHILENDKVLLTKEVDDLKQVVEKKISEQQELMSLKYTLEQKLQEIENKLDESIRNKNEIENDKLQMQERIAILENRELSNNNTFSHAEILKLTTEKSELTNNLNETLKENSTLKENIVKLQNENSVLEQKLQDLENNLDESIRNRNEHESDELQMQDRISLLESQALSNNNASSHAEFLKLTTEKTELTSNLSDISKENSTLKENIVKLKNEISYLSNLIEENESLKNCNSKLQQNVTSLQNTIVELTVKVSNQESLHKEISDLRDENHSILERKLQIEAELASTDGKIISLENEFEKIIKELNEKDIIIENLNATVVQNQEKMANLSQNVIDLENTLNIKNLEIERLNQLLEDLNEKYNLTSQNSIDAQEELNRLAIEKDLIDKQVKILNEELAVNDGELKKLTVRTSELESHNTDLKNRIATKDKEIMELNKSIIKLSETIKLKDNLTHLNDEYAKLVHEKDAIQKQVTEFENQMTLKLKEIDELKINLTQYEKKCLEYKTVIDNATIEKTELINLINLKHNESIQYHNEIQRLNQVLLEQANEFKRMIEEKDKSVQNYSEICTNCDNLRVTLKEKDEIITALNQNLSDYEKMKQELIDASDTIKSLNERCKNLDKSLGIQLENVKKLTTDNAKLSEEEQNSTRELERLRAHLVEMEESYTHELMTSEQKLTECQARLHQIEERAKQTSTVYTSNSIRANQEVETLRNQIKLLEKQREEVQARLSEAEDSRSRSEAALINLQVVLEQFQLDKERDIQSATEKIRNKMDDLKRQNGGLQDEISRLNLKLEEALAGLQAATRLGDQVEMKTAQINDLKEQVRILQTSVSAAEERYYNAISNQQDKVDKNLVKNLIINYILTAAQNASNKTQVLRVLSTVLDFNQQECEKLGLVRSTNTSESLAAEFVKFLQNESRPRAPLPNMMGIAQSTSRSTTPSSRKNSTLGPHPVFESTQGPQGHTRNPSTGSNNLLFQNIDALETASQRSTDSEPRFIPVNQLDTGVNQTRNTEGAILKHVLKDM